MITSMIFAMSMVYFLVHLFADIISYFCLVPLKNIKILHGFKKP